MTYPDSCTVRLIDMPASAGGCITEDPDGHVNIYLNARYSRAGQRRAWKHELRHWEAGDLHTDRDIREKERAADGPEALRRVLPQLMRARDLIRSSPFTQIEELQTRRVIVGFSDPPKLKCPSKPMPVPKPRSGFALPPYQSKVLTAAIAELDAFLLDDRWGAYMTD